MYVASRSVRTSGRHHASRCHMDCSAARDPHRGVPLRGPTQGTRTGDPYRGPTQRGRPHRGPTTGGEGHTGDPHRTHTDMWNDLKNTYIYIYIYIYICMHLAIRVEGLKVLCAPK